MAFVWGWVFVFSGGFFFSGVASPLAGASAEVEEVYTFPGYYTVHFTTSDGDMQMINISGYNRAEIFHKWHGKHLQ